MKLSKFLKLLLVLSALTLSGLIILNLPSLSRAPAGVGAEWVVDWIRRFPFSDRLDDYMQALGVSKYGAGRSGANDGLIEFNNQLLVENSCFAELFSRFITEVKETDLRRIISTPSVYSQKPSLAEKLNQNSTPKAGFLWETALKYADNDPNLAMHLIGVCGHDDFIRADLPVPEIKDKVILEKTDKLLSDLAISMKTAYPDFSFEEDYWREYLTKPNCPGSFSSMYVPGSLSPEADISEELKDKVGRVQAPQSGKAGISAKYYHVIGGAVATCLLTQRGVPSLIAGAIHSRALDAYRSKTICELTSIDALRGVELNRLGELTETELKAFVAAVKKNESLCPDTVQIESQMDKTDLFCSLWRSNPDIPEEPSELRQLSFLKRRLARADAAYLMSQTPGYAEGRVCEGVDLRRSLEKAIGSVEKSACPKNWTSSRCQAAINTLSTWLVDFEWSRAAQIAGQKFSAKKCQSISSGTQRLKHACPALAKWAKENSEQVHR